MYIWVMNSSKTYRIVLRKEPQGIYTAIVPALPGCITWGDNIEHAMEMAKEAIIGYIEVLQEEGEPVPDDNETLEYSLQLTA
jgi:antitoxin HicB